MLIRYKKNMEKIAMGLLSFMPEDKKDFKKLQKRIKEYEKNPNWHLYLWKEDDDIIGAIGVRIDGEIDAIIQDLSVNPSHRNQGLGKSMITEINNQFEKKYAVSPTEETEAFYRKYEETENA